MDFSCQLELRLHRESTRVFGAVKQVCAQAGGISQREGAADCAGLEAVGRRGRRYLVRSTSVLLDADVTF